MYSNRILYNIQIVTYIIYILLRVSVQTDLIHLPLIFRLSLVGSDSVEDKTAVTIKFPLTPPIRDQIQPPNVQPPNVQPSNGQPPNGQPPNVAVPVDQSIGLYIYCSHFVN